MELSSDVNITVFWDIPPCSLVPIYQAKSVASQMTQAFTFTIASKSNYTLINCALEDEHMLVISSVCYQKITKYSRLP
jgi:hypothetical protein